MNDTYRKYYANQLEASLLFQDFVVDLCWSSIGLAVVQYASRAYQAKVGESRTGVEIKHDMKFAKSRRLWIELREKATQRDGPYVESGINRDDNSWLYIIGDYDTVFVFAKTVLRLLAGSNRYPLRENGTKTSVGYLLPEHDAERYAAVLMRPHASGTVAKVVGDLSRLGRELHEATLVDPSQMSLFAKMESEAAP